MKFYRVALKKHAPFRQGRDGKKSSIRNFVQLRMRCIQLGSHSHGKNPAKFLDFLHLETILCTILTNDYNLQQRVLLLEGKYTYGKGIEQINCRSIGALFDIFAIFVRALPRISTSAKNCVQQRLFSEFYGTVESNFYRIKKKIV